MSDYGELEQYKGHHILGVIEELPTTWRVSMKAGRYQDGELIETVAPLIQDFGKNEGAINAGQFMIRQAKDAIDLLPGSSAPPSERS